MFARTNRHLFLNLNYYLLSVLQDLCRPGLLRLFRAAAVFGPLVFRLKTVTLFCFASRLFGADKIETDLV